MLKLYLIFVLLILSIFIFYFTDFSVKETFDNNNFPKIQSWIINLDKNKDRLNQSMAYYNSSDLSTIPIKRYSAIVGANLEPENLLSQIANEELYQTLNRGYRTRHYQLTKGGIGCYLSHMNLYKQLIDDPVHDVYLILEDDIKINYDTKKTIDNILTNFSEGWDFMLLGYLQLFNYKIESPSQLQNTINKVTTAKYAKVKSFWGMHAYLINKRGAAKFLKEHSIIECQIDSFISWLAIKNKINIYSITTPVIFPDSFYTDIQMNIFPKDMVDAFTYRDVYLGE
jgi:GR25 family glycosyltransferase involved in LPS biosynthesis